MAKCWLTVCIYRSKKDLKTKVRAEICSMTKQNNEKEMSFLIFERPKSYLLWSSMALFLTDGLPTSIIYPLFFLK